MNTDPQEKKELDDIKNLKRHSTFGRISLADQEKINNMVAWNNEFGNEPSDSENSINSPTNEERISRIKDNDRKIFDIESDTKLSEKNKSSQALLRSISKEDSKGSEEKKSMEVIRKSSLSPKEIMEISKEDEMETIKEKVGEYDEKENMSIGVIQEEEIHEEEEGKMFFDKQIQRGSAVDDMHSFEIISESIQLGDMCKHSQLILKDIKNDVLQKEKFSFSNLFSLKRFVGMFGGSNNNKMVEYFYDKHLS